MREIKFKRVFKNRSTGEISFMEWGNIDFRGQSVFDFSSFASPGTNSHSGPIADLQYTGLKDKNGKEIYEADICATYSKEYPRNKKVVWNQGMACFEFDYPLGKSIQAKDSIEIIGNIYENPELLNSDKEVQGSDTRDGDSSTKAD